MMRKRNALFVSVFIVIFLGIVTAAIFEDNDSGDFSQGNFYRTFYNLTSNFVQLNISQGHSVGNFSSRIFDAGINSTWNNITWTTEVCYQCELPNNGIVEQGDFVRFSNMSGNILLLHLNEQSGNIIDYSLYGQSGVATLFEGPEYNALGKFNTSLDFEANAVDYINFTSPSHLSNIGNQFTMEAWVNAESFTNSPTIVDKDYASAFSFYYSSSRLRTTIVTNTGSTTVSGSRIHTTGDWYHVVFTYNGTAMQLYTDGSTDGNSVAKTGNISTTSKDFIVGSGWEGNNPRFYPFDGLIDEVAIYNRSLTAQEIRDHYLRGVLRLNLSVRSCDDASCVGESFTKINGTSPRIINLNSERYFQYNFDFTTENTTYTPKLYNASTDYSATNIPPLLNITYPLNNLNYSIIVSAINYTVVDSSLESCWYSVNLGETNNSITCGDNVTGLSSNQGTNVWRVYANDTLGSENSSSVSFFVDTIGPNISIVNPINNSLLTTTTVRVNYTVSDSGAGVSGCWWTNSSGLINTTITCGNNFTFTGNEGTNFIRIYSNDTLGNLNSQTNTFLINTQAPTVNILHPGQGSVAGSITGIALNFSVIDPALQSCWYTLTEGFSNVTLSGCQNTTFDVNSDGFYEIILYANDTTGNVGFDSNDFTVSVDAPSINLISPISQYFNSANAQKFNFTYTPSDFDLQSCSLWINTTGNFVLNQTNNTVISGQDNSFFLNLSTAVDGAYSWAVQCNDTLAHYSITGNQTFYLDRIRPNVTVSEPTGTYTSLTNIPISLTYADASPVQCYWNVTFAATGNIVIGNSELAGCTSTTFTLDTESSYFFWMSVNDSAGNVNTTRKSFTVEVSSGSGPTSGSGSGSSGSGGGSSSGVRQSYMAELEAIDKLGIRRGESESIELPVKNSGLRFLNNCLFTKSAGVSEWISGQDIYSLSPGQSITYVFSVSVPIDADVGNYFVTLGVDCQEVNSSFTYQIEVLGGDFELNILESERIGTKLRINYIIENFAESEKELNVNYKLIDSDDQTASEGTFDSVRLLAKERKEFGGEFELPRNAIGDYNLIMEVSDSIDISQRQQAVRLTTGGISGFAISDNNLRAIAWFGIIVLLLFGMFIVIKVIRSQLAIRRANLQNERQFITIDLN